MRARIISFILGTKKEGWKRKYKQDLLLHAIHGIHMQVDDHFL